MGGFVPSAGFLPSLHFIKFLLCFWMAALPPSNLKHSTNVLSSVNFLIVYSVPQCRWLEKTCMLELITVLRNQAVLVIGHWVGFEPPAIILWAWLSHQSLTLVVFQPLSPCNPSLATMVLWETAWVTPSFLVPCTCMSSACFRVLVQIVLFFPNSIVHM